MHTLQIILVFACFLTFAAVLAQRAHIAYPTAFLLGGAAMAFIPRLPVIAIPPDYILPIFLPPLLMEAAYFTSLREFKRNLRPIVQLAVGLVIATAGAVAYGAQGAIPGMTLTLGFLLGAIVSPPDAAAATAIIRRIGVPKRIVSILEGESLINDAVGLILYKFAVSTLLIGGFAWTEVGVHFLWAMTAGVGIGLLIALSFVRLFPRIHEPSVEILSTFIVAYASYLLAENLHASGVLAVVTAGLVVGWHAPSLFTPRLRIPIEAVWRMVTFVLNGIAFLLIGSQLPGLLANLSAEYSPLTLLSYASIICMATLVTRFLWVYIVGYGVRFLFPAIRKRDPYPSWQNMFIIAWTGMRGVVSLATALALPLTLADGTPFPHRELIIFLAVSVIFFTLVLQGLTLPWLLGRLALTYDFSLLEEDWKARHEATKKALEKLDAMAGDETLNRPALERIRGYYEERLASLGDGPNTPLTPTEVPDTQNHPLIQAERRIWHDVIETERDVVIGLRKAFAINDDIMHEILRDLDLQASRY